MEDSVAGDKNGENIEIVEFEYNSTLILAFNVNGAEPQET